MDQGLAAVAGAVVGLLGALIVAGFQARSAREDRKDQARNERQAREDQARNERQAREDQARRDLQRERLRHYVDLLTTAREVRYISLRTFQKLATRSVSEVDESSPRCQGPTT
jgi:hypothetical protein